MSYTIGPTMRLRWAVEDNPINRMEPLLDEAVLQQYWKINTHDGEWRDIEIEYVKSTDNEL
jgi:hypothetical protein